MSKIGERFDIADAIAKYHNASSPKNSKRFLCWEVAKGVFMEKIKEISDAFKDIDKKTFKSQQRYFNCFVNLWEKTKKVVVAVSIAVAYFFRHLGGVIFHPNLSMRSQRVSS